MTVLHQGRVFAEGYDRRDHRRPGRAPHLSGEGLSHGRPILAAEGLRSGYATGDVLQGVGVEVASGRDRGRAGSQRRRQEHADPHLDRPAAGARRPDPLQGRGHHPARAPIVAPGAASAMCRRAARSSRTCRSWTICAWAASSMPAGGALRARRGAGLVPVPARAAAPARRHAVGRTAGDAGDRPGPGQRPRPDAARRAERRRAALDRAGDRRLPGGPGAAASRSACCWSSRTST